MGYRVGKASSFQFLLTSQEQSTLYLSNWTKFFLALVWVGLISPLVSAMVGLGFIPVTFLHWVFFACFICSCLDLGTPSQTCDPNDLLALKEFAGNLTNGSIISSWSNESICCEWDGIECGNGSSANKVIMLNLSTKGLTGVISGSLGSLDQLKLLNLSWNHLEGGLPAEFSNLTKLA